MSYQPTWRDGSVLAAGERDCADRYEPIRDLLATIDGPFTVLDLGANSGYFSARIADDFPAADVTAVDPRPELQQAASDRVTVVRQRMDATALRALPRHDVVLALSVLHHLPDWRQALGWLRACRRWLVAEVPHPGERWMRSAAARHELGPLHDAVAKPDSRKLGAYERTGRDGSRHMRPMYLIPGNVHRRTGVVFGGSGSNSRIMPRFSTGLDAQLGYQPVPGSLNLRLDQPVKLGPPAVDWLGRHGGRTRDYQMWPAWIGDLACHAMVPGRRNHGPDCLEMLAPVRLRDQYSLADGNELVFDVAVTDE